MDFTDDEADYSLAKRLDEFPNVIISRTFSKSFGMAGLRLGYAIVPEELADHYWRVRLPFSVNLMAEEAGIGRAARRGVPRRDRAGGPRGPRVAHR